MLFERGTAGQSENISRTSAALGGSTNMPIEFQVAVEIVGAGSVAAVGSLDHKAYTQAG